MFEERGGIREVDVGVFERGVGVGEVRVVLRGCEWEIKERGVLVEWGIGRR